MTHEQKIQITDALNRYLQSGASVASLQGITPAVIAMVRNNNWELLTEHFWHHLARQVGFFCSHWSSADTSTSLLLRIIFNDARQYAMNYCTAISSGLGKTFTASQFLGEQPGTIYFAASPAHNRRSFLSTLAAALGLQQSGTVPALLSRIVTHISAQQSPLLIIDDAQYLKERVLHTIVSLSQSLSGTAGIVLMGNDQFRHKIYNGMESSKPVYQLCFNTFGSRFITLTSLAPRDVDLVCRANGINDHHTISAIVSACGNNLHSISTLVQQYSNLNMAA